MPDQNWPDLECAGPMTEWKHDDLADELARYLVRSRNCLAWTNIGISGWNSVRPDVFTVNKKYGNPRPTTYEIKVTRSDFRSDITSRKWESYREFSAAVVFAAPLGLIDKGELPRGCGLIQRGKTWRFAKAPGFSTFRLSEDQWLKLLMGKAGEIGRVERWSDWRARERAIHSIGTRFGYELAELLSERVRARPMTEAEVRDEDV